MFRAAVCILRFLATRSIHSESVRTQNDHHTACANHSNHPAAGHVSLPKRAVAHAGTSANRESTGAISLAAECCDTSSRSAEDATRTVCSNAGDYASVTTGVNGELSERVRSARHEHTTTEEASRGHRLLPAASERFALHFKRTSQFVDGILYQRTWIVIAIERSDQQQSTVVAGQDEWNQQGTTTQHAHAVDRR